MALLSEEEPGAPRGDSCKSPCEQAREAGPAEFKALCEVTILGEFTHP